MAKTIKDYKLDYAVARKKGDLIGQAKANAGANKIRKATGQKTYSSVKGDMQHAQNLAKTATGLKATTLPTIQPTIKKSTLTGLQRNQLQNQKAIKTTTLPKATAATKAVAPITLPVANKTSLPSLKQNMVASMATNNAIKQQNSLLGQTFDKKENYIDKAKKGNIKGATLNFVGSGVQGAQSLYMNTLNNADSLVSGKGLAPFKHNMDYTDYESSVAKRHGDKTITQRLTEKNKTLGAAYNIGMNIATDPLNLLDGAAALKAKGLKTPGSLQYADDLLKGGKTFAPITLKSGKQVAKVEDLKDLKTSEKAEAVQAINNNRKKLSNTTVKGNAKPLPQASNQAVQPQNIDLGTMVQQEVKTQPIPIRKPLAKSIEKTPSIEDKMKAIEAEHNRTVDVVHNYIKNYKPKGVDINLVPKSNEYGADEFFRQNASKNDLWYQDFYKENGRKPNGSEMRELAEKIVMRDLDDVHGEFHNADLADMINKIDEPQSNAIEPQNFKRGTNTPKRPFQSVGADLNSNPSKYKVSQLRTNTIENSEQFANLKGDMPQENFEYEVRPEKVTNAEAKQRLETDFEGEVDDLYFKTNFDGADTDTAMGIAKTYGEEATQTGNYTRLNNWSKQIQEKATEQGQAIQAFAKYTRTAEGKVIEGQSEVAKVQREIAKDNPRLTDKVEQETKQITDTVMGAEKQAKTVAEKFFSDYLIGKSVKNGVTVQDLTLPNPNELGKVYKADSVNKLASKVESTTKTTTRQTPPLQKVFDDMVSELYRVAKESPLPQKKAVKANPIDALTEAINHKELYGQTWENAKAVLKDKYKDNAEVSAMLEDYFNKGIIPTYSKKTLENNVRQTAKELTVDFSKIIKQSAGDKEKALQDITDLLINKTGAAGEDASLLAKNITDQYNAILKARTESTLKQMFREVPKKGQKTTYQKVMELINMGAYDNQAIKDIIRAKNNIPVMDNEDIKGIFENMKLSEEATDPYMKKMYEAKAQQIISDKVPATKMEKFAGLQRQSMLINPKTLVTRNPLGNVVLGTAENIKDIPASAIDKLISLKTGERTTILNPQLGAQAKGVAQGLKDWTKDIKYGVDTSPTRAQFELPNKRIFNNPVLNSMDKFLGKALQLGDRPFYQAAYDGRIAQLNKLGVVGEEAETQARLFALDRVFQNDSVLSQNALIIRDKLGLPGRLIMPFAQTPANIMDKLLDYSPAGLLKEVYQLATTAGKGTFDQKLFVDRLARTFTGTGIAMLGYAMAKNGILTGNTDDPINKDLNAANTLAGTQSYAIKIGDKWHSYDFAQPIGGLLAASADAYKAGTEGKDFIGKLGAGGIAAVNTVFNQSFMSGLLDAFSGYSPAEGIGGALLSSTSQITPTVLNNVAKTIDPYSRETYDPNVFKQQANKLVARIPFASKTLPKKLDVTGKPILLNQGRGVGSRIVENFLAPQKITQVKKEPVNDELLRLNKETGSNGVLLNTAEKSISRDNTKYTLTPEEYQQYQKEMGNNAYDRIGKLITTSKYKNMDDGEKAKALDKINTDAKHQAQNSILLKRGVIDELADMSDKQVEKYNLYAKDLDISKAVFAETVTNANKLKSDKYPNGESKENVSRKKKDYIDKMNPNATREQLKVLYESAGVASSVGHYRKQFE